MRGLALRLLVIPVLAVTSLAAYSSILAAPAGRNDTITETEYWDLMESTQQALARLKAGPAAAADEGLAELAAQWETVQEVSLQDGQVIPMDNRYLLGLLRAEDSDLERVQDMLETLLAAHSAYPSRVFTTADLAPLTAILAAPEFTWPEPRPNPIREWFQRLWDRFLRWLDRILGGRQITIGTEIRISPLLAIAAILLVLILLFVFRSLFVDFVREARLAEQKAAEELLTSESAFERAQALSRGGDYRSAVRYLYLSSLLLLDERGLLRYDRSRTNREYLRSVAGSPELADPLREVVEVFDDVWYGYHALDEKDFKQYTARVEELKERQP